MATFWLGNSLLLKLVLSDYRWAPKIRFHKNDSCRELPRAVELHGESLVRVDSQATLVFVWSLPSNVTESWRKISSNSYPWTRGDSRYSFSPDRHLYTLFQLNERNSRVKLVRICSLTYFVNPSYTKTSISVTNLTHRFPRFLYSNPFLFHLGLPSQLLLG